MWLVENQTASALMLWAEADNGRLAHKIWQPLLVSRRKSVIAPGDNVIEFIQRIAVGHPRLAFLIGVKEIARAIERERNRHANAGGDGGKLFRALVPLLNRAAPRIQ